MHKYIVFLLIFISPMAYAEMYKCVENGNTSYQDTPCKSSNESSGSISLGAQEAPLPWADLNYGMSPEEVYNRIAGAAFYKANPSTPLNNWVVKKGAYVARVKFTAFYYFKEKKLVTIYVAEPKTVAINEKTNDATRRRFDQIVAALREKYGDEKFRKIKEIDAGLAGGARWITKDGQITMGIKRIDKHHSYIGVELSLPK